MGNSVLSMRSVPGLGYHPEAKTWNAAKIPTIAGKLLGRPQRRVTLDGFHLPAAAVWLHGEAMLRMRVPASEKEVVTAHGSLDFCQRLGLFLGGLILPVEGEPLATVVAISVWMAFLVLAKHSHRSCLLCLLSPSSWV